MVLDGGNCQRVQPGFADDTGGVDLAAQSLTMRAQPIGSGPAGGIMTTQLGTGRAGPVRVTATHIDMRRRVARQHADRVRAAAARSRSRPTG